jgi:hypothetical protein
LSKQRAIEIRRVGEQRRPRDVANGITDAAQLLPFDSANAERSTDTMSATTVRPVSKTIGIEALGAGARLAIVRSALAQRWLRGFVRIRKMPVNVVRTPEEEIAWERAKARAHEEYPDATGARFNGIVMTIGKKMVPYQPNSSIVIDRAADARRMR